MAAPSSIRAARRGLDGDGGQPAAGDQHKGVDAAENGIELRLTRRKDVGKNGSRDREGREEEPEGHHFGQDQHPHHRMSGKIREGTPRAVFLRSVHDFSGLAADRFSLVPPAAALFVAVAQTNLPRSRP